jgi:two-component system CheB/CheR fusion protein
MGKVENRAGIRRVLVVDDNKDVASSTAMLLRRAGHEVHLAHDGPEALELARFHHPDVVLLDIGLPGMDGYEVARRLRIDSDVPLVAMSGYTLDNDGEFDYCLVKPVRPAELLDLVARLPNWDQPPSRQGRQEDQGAANPMGRD